MADPSTCLPLTADSIHEAHQKIKPYVHRTPVLTCRTLDRIASSVRTDTPNGKTPRLKLFFKCENLQKIGAFKARGAHYAVLHLIEAVGIDRLKDKGVITHSSGNHAQALALAAYTFDIPSYIVMPTISTPSKIAGTKQYASEVIFSGSTSSEREAKVAEVMGRTGAILVPPYDHPDIILGQGTVGVEFEQQYQNFKRSEQTVTGVEEPQNHLSCSAALPSEKSTEHQPPESATHLNAILVPLGGGGLLGGIATYFSGLTPKTYIFGAEPSHEGADDARRGLSSQPPKRIEHVSSLTVADGLRTPVGLLNWSVISNQTKVEGVYAVTESQIKEAMKLVLERMKMVVEPSAAVPLAVALYNEEWRGWVCEKQRAEAMDQKIDLQEVSWDVGVVFSGGNTTVEAIGELFRKETDREGERADATVGKDGRKEIEDVAG